MIPAFTPVDHRASEEDPCPQSSPSLPGRAGFVPLLLLGLALGSSGALLAFCRWS